MTKQNQIVDDIKTWEQRRQSRALHDSSDSRLPCGGVPKSNERMLQKRGRVAAFLRIYHQALGDEFDAVLRHAGFLQTLQRPLDELLADSLVKDLKRAVSRLHIEKTTS